jgi:hypothetical protein
MGLNSIEKSENFVARRLRCMTAQSANHRSAELLKPVTEH